MAPPESVATQTKAKQTMQQRQLLIFACYALMCLVALGAIQV
ncbi:hypothetical protein V7x_49020 [Crateriforma conspicua]|uniref:Uncharacterized protein n=1 Tax=Crateriforma conspicua TaxID=2527996 RepID=A0A5C6FPJ8_9PLAN|nr:hypothetical protein V7x_49020 [Crateriforma conspicua]